MTAPLDIVPEAYFDVAATLADAPQSVTPMTVVEAHLYAYLGCVLGLFKGQAVGDWGYAFAVTKDGFPFSAQLEIARGVVVDRGLVDEDPNGMMRARSGALVREVDLLLSFSSWRDRRTWLRAATQCALALPVGSIRHAIGRSPGLETSLKLRQRRQLLQSDDVDLLYDEYKIVSSVLGNVMEDLLSPAVIWLSARVLRGGDVS